MENRAQREEKMRRFFDEGCPGEKLKPQFEKMLRVLQVPKAIYDAELDSIMRFVESTLESAGGAEGAGILFDFDL
jgi:hypothetical protein